MPFPDRPPHALHDRVGQEGVRDLDVVRSGAAHAERPPGVEDLHPFRLERQRKVEHGRSALGVVVNAGRHQDVAGRHAARENLPPGQPVAAVNLFEPARSVEPVRAAARNQDQVFGGDAPQHRLGRLVAGPPEIRERPDQVRVHREGQRRRAAVPRQLADHPAQLAMRRAAATELRGHAGRERAALAQRGVVFSDERVVLVVLRRPLRELAAQRRHERGPIRGAWSWLWLLEGIEPRYTTGIHGADWEIFEAGSAARRASSLNLDANAACLAEARRGCSERRQGPAAPKLELSSSERRREGGPAAPFHARIARANGDGRSWGGG